MTEFYCSECKQVTKADYDVFNEVFRCHICGFSVVCYDFKARLSDEMMREER